MKTRPFSRVRAAGAGLLFAGLLSCTPAEQRHERAAAARPPAARHAMHSERLRAVMLQMGSEAAQRWPQEIASERAADAEREQTFRFDEARRLAAALDHAAVQIPDAVVNADLSQEQRSAFMLNVARLRAHAGRLATSAARRDLADMRATLDAVRTTCNDCHAQFRELAGPVELPPSAM